MREYYLGVDGGQSSTTALIGDASGRVLGVGRAGPCNHVGAEAGHAKFVAAIGGALSAACDAAQLDLNALRFRACCFGFSGGPADKDAITREIVPSDSFVIVDDAAIALSGAMAGEPGIIVIAGTGSIAFGRNSAGKTARAGGWGYIFGDEGGGFDLARQALRAALRYEEGWGPATSLHGALLNAVGARDANDVLHRFYTDEFPRPRIAALAMLVDQAAECGDAIARTLLDEAAGNLAALARAVRDQLFIGVDAAPVCPIGGAFNSRLLREKFRTAIDNVAQPIYGPAAGALIEAYRAAGRNPQLTDIPEIEK
jgi:N-acetylglucosamine kinase-like BadF-type ATPase